MQLLADLLPSAPLLAALLVTLGCSSSGPTAGSGGDGPSYACAGPCGPVSLAQSQHNPWPITAHGGRVFWMDHVDPGAFMGALRSVATTGGEVTDVAMTQNVRGEGASSVAADDQNVYFTTGGGNLTNEIDVVPLGGGTPRTLFRDMGLGNGGLSGVVAGSGAVFTQASGGLLRIDPTSGKASPVDDSADCWAQILIDGEDLFCAGGNVVRYPLAGGAPVSIAGASPPKPEALVGIAVDASHLYMMSYDDQAMTSSVYALPRSGGTRTQLASGLQVKSSGFVANDAGVFWIAGTPGGSSFPLMRLAPSGGPPSVAGTRGAANFLAADAHGVYLPDYYGDIDEYVF